MDAKQSFPYLKSVPLGENKEESRDVIKSFDGEIVYIKDSHQGGFYLRAKIEFDEEDSQCYKAETYKGKLQLHFHDLEGLLSPL